MAQVPFTVSARTARLIGRENIATSKGAIIELVKNGYDADSKVCIVFFDNRFSVLVNKISAEKYQYFLKNSIPEKILELSYKRENDEFILLKEIKDDIKIALKRELNKLNTLYIIDAGEGMTQKIIRENWMTIGTDNKLNDVFTKDGRVKSGAKGIGRFALDKLGGKCEMITKFNPDPEIHEKDVDEEGNPTNNKGYNWKVNWSDFEGEFKTINKVFADLEGYEKIDLKEMINNLLPDNRIEKLTDEFDFDNGTILKISNLRENWEDFFVGNVFSDLEVLVPPKENEDFSIFLFSSLEKEKYGEITGSVCEDYDYKIVAKADENQNVSIKIFRNEYDIETIDSEFFERDLMKKKNYRREDFQKGFWKTSKTFSQLLPGFSKVDDEKVFDNIGVFDFTLYYMKKTFSTPDAEKFFTRRFMSQNRKTWLEKFGGIKLYRDNFRVRPYGEINDVAFDWLDLGKRKTSSPAGIAKEEGGWKVEADNVAGAIKISRLTNVDFEDKSSREGLQESKTFQVFKKIITNIISEFEKDRALIAREMSDYYAEKYSEEITRKQAEKIAKAVLERKKQKQKNKETDASDSNSEENESTKEEIQKDNELIVLAELNKEKSDEIESLKDEQKILRGLASSGIVLASFSHDLSKLSNNLNSRIDRLKVLISDNLIEKDFSKVENRKNPFYFLEKMKKQDLKLQNWLQFSLGVARKDKRRRKQLNLLSYFKNFEEDWKTILVNRGVNLNISEIEPLSMRVYEIDLDSIFNNLLINSIDAFNTSIINRERKVKIIASSSSTELIIDYYDNGPGLSSDIIEKEEIFNALYTTKRNKHTGDEEGTGLGMWLVKSITNDNDGKVKLLYPKDGFGIKLIFPVKFKKKRNV